MLNEIKKISLIILLLFILDLLNILTLNKSLYIDNFKIINNGDFDITTSKFVIAVLCYFIMAFGIYYFSIKNKSILNATILGFLIYGVYNATNYASINKYSFDLAIRDTIAGTLLFTSVAFIVNKIFN